MESRMLIPSSVGLDRTSFAEGHIDRRLRAYDDHYHFPFALLLIMSIRFALF